MKHVNNFKVFESRSYIEEIIKTIKNDISDMSIDLEDQELKVVYRPFLDKSANNFINIRIYKINKQGFQIIDVNSSHDILDFISRLKEYLKHYSSDLKITVDFEQGIKPSDMLFLKHLYKSFDMTPAIYNISLNNLIRIFDRKIPIMALDINFYKFNI